MQCEYNPYQQTTQQLTQGSQPNVNEKKPKKYQEKIQKYIKAIQSDSAESILRDILEENERIRKEIDTLRSVNAAQKREYDEFRAMLLSDRISNCSLTN